MECHLEETSDSYKPTLFPDLLSASELQHLLFQHFRKTPKLLKLSKEELLNAYNTMLQPLPQRDYPSTFRGLRLKKRRIKAGISTEVPATLSLSASHENFQKLTPKDRLKPPPEVRKKFDASKTGSTDSQAKSVQKTKIINDTTTSMSIGGNKRSNPAPTGKSQSESSKPKRSKITWP